MLREVWLSFVALTQRLSSPDAETRLKAWLTCLGIVLLAWAVGTGVGLLQEHRALISRCSSVCYPYKAVVDSQGCYCSYSHRAPK